MTTRYTTEQTDNLIAAYKSATTDAARKAVVVSQATSLGKSTQSVISKLSREGVYVKPIIKAADTGPNKEQYIRHIAIMLGIRDVSRLDSFEKVSKPALMLVSKHLNELNNTHEAESK